MVLSRSTAELLQLYRDNNGEPSISDIQRCVDARADVTVLTDDELKRPMLSCFIANHNDEAVKACMKSPININWMEEDMNGMTILHYIVGGPQSTHLEDPNGEVMSRYLALLFDRLESHGRGSIFPDKIHWGKSDKYGHECISYATLYGKLYLFWKIMKENNVEHYSRYSDLYKIKITFPPVQEDYERLDAKERGVFFFSHLPQEQ